MTYEEYLKANGATAEDITVLNTPTAQRIFAKTQADLAAAQTRADAEAKKAQGYQTWYENEALPYVTTVESKLKASEATLTGERARIKALQEAGLLEVANADDAAKAAAAAAAAANHPTFDPAKFVPVEKFNELATRAADSITLVADLAQEHAALGLPPVSWRDLKNKAAAANQTVESYWETTFNVPAKRAEKAAAEKAAYEKQVGENAVAAFKAAHPASAVNPALGYGGISANPFTGKVPSASDATLPWLRSDTEKVNARINGVLAKHPDLVQ